MTTCVKIIRKSNVSDPLELVNQNMVIEDGLEHGRRNNLERRASLGYAR